MCSIIHITITINSKSMMCITMCRINMPHTRIDITLHPEELEKLDRICKKRGYLHKSKKKDDKIIPKRSTMIARLIQEYDESKDKVK